MGKGRPDASMSLLDDITATALDPAYARAARDRTAGATPGARHRTHLATFAVLLVPGLLLAIAVVHAQRGAPALERQHNRLVASIRDRERTAGQLSGQVAGLNRDVTALRRDRLAHSRRGRAAEAAITSGARGAALSTATGDGVRVTVDDAPARGTTPGVRVYDRDLQTLVNGLWAGGATGIAVNGQRITSTTAIRDAGSSVLVDFRPTSPPYRLDAIGDSGTILAKLADSAAGRRMQTLANTFGIRYDIQAAEDLRLPAGSGGTLRYARTAAR